MGGAGRAARRAAGARSEDVTAGGGPLPGEGRGPRLVQPRGRKEGEERRRPGGRASGAAGVAPGRRGRPSAPSRAGPAAGAAAGGVRGPRAAAQRLCSVLQVYPEPRSESECLSNIREFLRACGASLRLEVSGARPGRGGGRGRGAGRRRGAPRPPGVGARPQAGEEPPCAAPSRALACESRARRPALATALAAAVRVLGPRRRSDAAFRRSPGTRVRVWVRPSRFPAVVKTSRADTPSLTPFSSQKLGGFTRTLGV